MEAQSATKRMSETPVGGSPQRTRARMELANIEGMPPWAEHMMNHLTQHTTNEVAGLKIEVDEAKAMAMEAQENIRVLRAEMEEMKQVKAHKDVDQQPVMRNMETLQTEFNQLKIQLNSKGGKGKNYNAWNDYGKGKSSTTGREKDPETDKELEMLVWGFDQNTERKEIIAAMDKMLEAIPLEVEDTYTFEKTSSFGVIRFYNHDDKRWFKRYLMKNITKHGSNTLSVSENLGKEDSRKERSCGKVKKALCNAGASADDVVVKYRKGIVLLKKDTVAEWIDGKLVLSGRAKEIETDINKLLDEKQLRNTGA